MVGHGGCRGGRSERRTCSKWVGRYRAEGRPGLVDRPSTPKRCPTRTPEDRVRLIAILRTLRMTAAEIAFCLGVALSTVSAVLRRIGLGKRSRLDPVEPPNRYERARPGELLHIDVKKLGGIQEARATASPAADQGCIGLAARAGTTSMSASMTPPAWLTSKSSQTKRPPPSRGSCAARFATNNGSGPPNIADHTAPSATSLDSPPPRAERPPQHLHLIWPFVCQVIQHRKPRFAGLSWWSGRRRIGWRWRDARSH